MKKRNWENWIGLLPVVLSILLIYSGFEKYSKNISGTLNQINDDIAAQRTVVLDSVTDQQMLSEIIFENGYAATQEDAAFISRTLIERQKEPPTRSFLDHLLGKNKDHRLENLWSLQKRDIGQIAAHVADSCQVLNTIFSVSREKIGVANDSVFPYNRAAHSGPYSIRVVVEDELERTSLLQLRKKRISCVNVPVRLQVHYKDTLGEPKPLTLGYVTTDEQGVAVFKGLSPDSSYSVLPIKVGCEYGRLRGVVGGDWKLEKKTSEKTFSFIEKEHRIPMFSNAALRQIKNERTIIVRSPDEYLSALKKCERTIVFLWLGLALFIMVLTALQKRRFSFRAGIIMACCLFLSGLSVLMMFSMQDPVNDELKGNIMTQGVCAGVLFVAFLQLLNLTKYYDWKKFPFWRWSKLSEFNTRGVEWVLLALGITLSLFVIGQDVGGMKVNINLFGLVFQPSEIAKYLIVLYAAIFFAENNGDIMFYSRAFGTKIWKKVKTSGILIAGLLLLMLLYFILSDMGPGLVIGVTFIFLYSFCKSMLEWMDSEKQDKDRKKWKGLVSCDLAMLIYGTVSFAVVLLLCWKVIGGRLWYLVGFLVWLTTWWFFGWISLRRSVKRRKFIWKKQLFETPIMMNAIILLFVAGNIIGQNNKGEDDIVSRIGSRIEERTSMCVNTWGGMDKIYAEVERGDTLPMVLSEPVSNIQVANSLWALASGGVFGQGWGNGKPNVVPAAHTDMILSSIGEQIGWIGLLIVVLVYWLLLRNSAKVGVESGQLFPLYLSMGIVIVTAVQFFIITLGSAGVIPLTGVTVPLLSYGRVSMILNIAAFGIVLSFATRRDKVPDKVAKVRKKRAKAYSHTNNLISGVFVVCAAFALCVWLKYQLFEREKTLIQPAYVINNEGNPVLEYNPRIGLITSQMTAGRIFDRNGLLLATSDKEDINVDSLARWLDRESLEALRRRHLKRYYPFGEHLFFMVGDINTGIMFSYDDNHPAGYMAEVQHLTYLRGFDNILYDKQKEKAPATIRLFTDKKQDFWLLPAEADTSKVVVLRDYRKLLPYLKDGSGKKLAMRNDSVSKGDFDLYLTVDAALQVDLQKAIGEFVQNYVRNTQNGRVELRSNNLLRVSAVVLDAKNGDLLASANYPLPDFERLRIEEDLAKAMRKKYARYADNEKGRDWQAYTDRDLGTTYQTAPGSTAKVMSAIAGFRKIGTNAENITYKITAGNQIEVGIEPTGNRVTMYDAIVQSSNCYFVNLVNNNDLYEELDTIYSTVGVAIGQIIPYYYRVRSDMSWRAGFDKKIADNREEALSKYRKFLRGELVDPKIGKKLGRDNTNMSVGEWKWAWGQGYSGYEIAASPLNMARIASTVVNGGVLHYTQYVRSSHDTKLRIEDSIRLMQQDEADILKALMKAETHNHINNRARVAGLPSFMGGKTGTAERTRMITPRMVFNKKKGKYVQVDQETPNDGWYIFFLEGNTSLAVAVRMERLRGAGNIEDKCSDGGSGTAVKLAGKQGEDVNSILEVLKAHHYVNQQNNE